MNETDLCFVWKYNDVDRSFWHEHLEGWLPREIIDAHTHFIDPALRQSPVTEEMRRQMWVNEASQPIDAPSAQRCIATVFPGRKVSCLAIGSPDLAYDIERSNEYVRAECLKRGWLSLAMLKPQWTQQQVAAELDKPGVIGVKPYYTLIGYNPHTRDVYQEASIFEFLPHHALEVIDQRRAWVTLHVPKAARLGHPDNIREIQEIRRRYPRVILVIAHLGRCYTEPHALEGLPPLADDEGLYFDNSAVLNPAVHRLALKLFGPRRVLYGTDNPVFYMRGRRTWEGRQYINHTSHDFYFNRGRREPPEIEAGYTLYMYEALKAIKDACADMGLGAGDVRAMFLDNAQRLLTLAAGPGAS
ncbi:MAG: amidohydrolase family protein [Phycisphaerae bacterium]